MPLAALYTLLMSDQPHILVVDDHRDIRDLLCGYLEKHGCRVTVADGGTALRKAIGESAIDIVVLDIIMPGEDGLSLCRWLRDNSALPGILLTAVGEETDRIVGLEMGADDYVTKPFNPRELLARVKAVLRRSGVEESKTLQVDNLTIYEDEYRASLEGKDLGLTLTEFELVRYLVRHPRKACTRQQLLETIWKDAMMVTERTVDAHIKNLREKLGSFAEHIQTVRGVGYRFVKELETQA